MKYWWTLTNLMTKAASKNNLSILQLILRPSFADLQSQNPQRSPATLAVLPNQID